MSQTATQPEKKADAAAEPRCPVGRARRLWADFVENRMCGKCHVCMLGSYEAVLILHRFERGKATPRDLDRLEQIAASMAESSRCKKGKDVAEAFGGIFEAERVTFTAHIGDDARCPGKSCPGLIAYKINPDRCTLCGECRDACRDRAIIGETRPRFIRGYPPFRIRQLACTKCDACRAVCPDDAVEIVDAKGLAEPIRIY